MLLYGKNYKAGYVQEAVSVARGSGRWVGVSRYDQIYKSFRECVGGRKHFIPIVSFERDAHLVGTSALHLRSTLPESKRLLSCAF